MQLPKSKTPPTYVGGVLCDIFICETSEPVPDDSHDTKAVSCVPDPA